MGKASPFLPSDALVACLPVMLGYFPIGIAFGIYAVAEGLAWYWPVILALVQYSGAGQFLLVALLANATPAFGILGTLVVLNMRHIFYGLPLLDSLPEDRIQKFLSIFWLTDEVYSVMTSRPAEQRPSILWVGFFAHLAWTFGCVLGSFVGQAITIPQKSLSFSLTALFVVMVIEQWRNHRTMLPIGCALIIWTFVGLLGSGLQLGFQLLIMIFGLILVLSAVHFLALNRQ